MTLSEQKQGSYIKFLSSFRTKFHMKKKKEKENSGRAYIRQPKESSGQYESLSPLHTLVTSV